MGFLVIAFQDKEKENNKESGTIVTHAEGISHVCDSLRFLEQLGTAEAAKFLDRVKSSGPNPPSFVFQSHDDPGSQTNSLFDKELPLQPPLTAGLDNCEMDGPCTTEEVQGKKGLDPTAFDASSLIEPSINTVNSALLTASTGDWDGDPSSVIVTGNLPVLEAEDNSLFVSPANNILARLEIPSTATPQAEDTDSPSTPSGFSDEASQLFSSGDLVMGLPTPLSDNPSPAAQVTKTTHHSSKPKQFKVTKGTGARERYRQEKSLMKGSTVKNQLGCIEVDRPVSIDASFVRNALHGLSDPDLQQALKIGEGLISDGLSEYQNSCIWQEGDFWFEDSLNLPISTGCSAEERFCQVFRYSNTLETCTSNQKLRLRISHALLYLSFHSLTRKKQSGIYSGRLENPGQHRAATLSTDFLLSHSYPGKWDSMDVEMKQTLRRRLHEKKRQGSRCWRIAGVLGLGALLAGGDTLARVIKNHSKYPIAKLDTVINYIFNAHPSVVSLYHEFDALAKQILLGETLTAHPTGQVIDNAICRAGATNLSPQEVEENWQQIDPVAVSRKFVDKFVSDYV
ncbi:hypothetical protein ACJ73_03687 [Blastomyces percursus]|uniref:Uncharacterized protein n=1 Tax=Blastomyces percursus TaxID=1658174 RepID=A0A1J9R8W7_9EURO|nr:hypothetical protein ACJ73_03687 [Blastomyces percursus]